VRLFVPDLIRRKRDGGELSAVEIGALVSAHAAGDVPDYQMSAMLMAIVFRGLSADELVAWTEAMIGSGESLDHSGVPGAKVDKHSTGGVGDKISLCLAPAVASLGVRVPMISGRGLGHTGGTLDKLEAIPGLRVDLSAGEARSVLERAGLFMIGQTDRLAPADRRLYALRDVTGTVESIPLIASSIMSKKLAEGIDALVLDVKVGEGAFMRDEERGRELARTIIGIGEAAGVRVKALLTRMDRPIGRAVGNALEVREAIEVMRGAGPPDTVELTRELGAEMLVLGGAAESADLAREAISRALEGGAALEVFARLVEAQGGDPEAVRDPSRLPAAAGRAEVTAQRSGFVARIDPKAVARAALEVGAGRRTKEDSVRPATGVEVLVGVGESVGAGGTLAEIHHDGVGRDDAVAIAAGAFEIRDAPPEAVPLVLGRM